MKSSRHKADTELVRKQNRSLVLEALRRFGPLASIELGDKTSLSPATISAITNDMLAERLIEADEAETARHRQAQRGRPKVKLKLSANAALILGIRLTHKTIMLFLTDFCGTVRARHMVSVDTSTAPADTFGTVLVETVRNFLDHEKLSPELITLASIACQGATDAVHGEIIWSPAFKARNIPIAKPLYDALRIKSIVANDTNLIAHGLHVHDDRLGDNFGVVYLGSGIGLGLFIKGELLEGANGTASEFGHMLWKENGALCRCGRRGCIEAYASDFGIFRSANPHLADTDPAFITPSAEDMRLLAEAVRNGDENAKNAFEIAGQAIGTGLGNLMMLLNPDHLLFAGPQTNCFDLIEPNLTKALDHARTNNTVCELDVTSDDRDLIEDGIIAHAFTKLDRDVFARRVSVEEMVARRVLTSS